MMRSIVAVHFPDLSDDLARACINAFYRLRKIDGVEKKPATRELLNWIRALLADPDFRQERLTDGAVPYLGILFKKSDDLEKAVSQVGE
jgi:hypothetical protein